ncbi:MAG TPA: carboxylating nicotinate-nucleotide diphosphorylase [Bacteroidota bacterium]|nr:carboxylating nicotinate-nucleotide diphosphorylase [Bacteroidota bacterium]
MTEVDIQQVRVIARRALEEDIGEGDITGTATVPPEAALEGRFIAKQDGVVAGLRVVREVFDVREPGIQIREMVRDGDTVAQGQLIATVRGNGRVILSCERVVLNLLQRMSGIATLTREFVDAVKGTNAIIVDTRKTAPGLRVLDKWAVRLGGGQNHRFGLYDMFLVKENHIAAAGGMKNAVQRIRDGGIRGRSVEVEVRNLVELREALELGVDQILLDNMDPGEMSKAVALTKGKAKLEASGNVTLQTVARIAATGVDIISVGMLTHSVRAMDISFLVE